MRLITTPLAGCLLAASVYAGKVWFPDFFKFFAVLEYHLLFLAGLIAGIRLPDLDLVLPGFRHRSGITHSCLFPAIALAAGGYAIAGGLALGIAMHLSSDMQPKAWTGGALIKLPLLGNIGMLSPIWILVNIVACCAVLFHVFPAVAGVHMWLIIVIIGMGLVWYFKHEEKNRLLPLLTLAFSVLMVHTLKGGGLSVDNLIQYLV